MRILKNIARVFFGNILTILSGVVVGFILPKIITVSEYGFYKIFTLYFNYLGVLSLGIIDGIVLKYGGIDYERFDRTLFRCYFAWYLIINACFTAVLLVSSLIFSDIDYKFVVLMLCVNLIPINLIGYFQQISQISQRFQEYSKIKILQSIANVVLVCVLFLINILEIDASKYHIYMVGLSVVNILLACWYIKNYWEIVWGSRTSLREGIGEIGGLMKQGFPLLLANLCSTLLLSLDRQFVSVLFSTEEYAVYAFAYSMLSLVTVATSAASIVIYPVFKRVDLVWLKEQYQNINTVVLVFAFLLILVYYPLEYFIRWFLPQYTYSISIFQIILPGLVISASLSIVIQNYYKTLEKSRDFFVKSVVALMVAFISNVIAYIIFRSRESISIASIISLLVWYYIADFPLRRVCKGRNKNILYITLMFFGFYFCTGIIGGWVGGVINFIFLGIATFLIYRAEFKGLRSLLQF